MEKRGHKYHIINPAPWPMLVSLILLNVVVGLILIFNKYIVGKYILICGLILILIAIDAWFQEIIREGTLEGKHTIKVKYGLKLGMLLFIISEVMFFFSFFWGNYYLQKEEVIQIGNMWPPYGIQAFNYLHIPLYNTMVLLISGIAVTWCHREVINANEYWGTDRLAVLWDKGLPRYDFFGKRYSSLGPIYSRHFLNLWLFLSPQRLNYRYSKIVTYNPETDHWTWPRTYVHRYISLWLTIVLAMHFTYWQYKEYVMSSFSITDGAYGSVFFLATGFHGFHVLLGTMLLTACFIRMIIGNIKKEYHLGLEFAIWYWHFVDVVWLFLFVMIYYWGSKFK